MTTAQFAILMLYRALLIGGLMYVVGYLEWSAWWLLLFVFFPTLDARGEK
jgi:hypothetical protein